MESSSSDEAPVLGGLFTDDRGSEISSGEDSYSESDREWRDAVKAAVETEIQYQVQLRLSVNSPRFGETGETEEQTEEARRELELRNRTRTRVSEKHQKFSVAEKAACEPPKAPDSREIQEQCIVTNTVGQKWDEQHGEVTKNKPKTEKKEPQTVYDYLRTKYGTPYVQLENLMKHGRFVCTGGSSVVGVDRRLSWPVECNIALPTPSLSSLHLQPRVPFFPDGPVLGLARPSFHRTPDSSIVVYDRLSDTQSSRSMEDGVLKFESRFESGNLHQAIHVAHNEYDLILNTDLYTERHTQWFYFQVSGMQSGEPYVFNIINFRKRNSLYNFGMKLLMYSEAEGGWDRVGENICYRKLPTCHHTPLLKQGTDYYYLSWKMEFPHEGDTCYFSHCYPYSFTSLLELLDSYEKNISRRCYFKREVLCETLAGNTCPLLTITDFETSEEEWLGKMGVVFSARVHPGETNSSWMMQGILDYLTSEHKHARYLRSKFVFKLIPMLNPDGVIVGNYRTSLSGVDLNRVYKNPIEKIFPTVSSAKKLIMEFNEERKVVLYVDLHGHSRSYNVFMYGCHSPHCDHQQLLQERAVPWMLSQISKEKFSFKKCKFTVQRCKEATGRVSIWREGIVNSFTMEASFCGTNLTSPTPLHFTPEDLMSMGQDLCEVLLKLHRYNKSNSYRFKVNSRIAESMIQRLVDEDNHSPSTPPPTLPDVVTSTKQREKIDAEEREKQAKRKSRQQMAKILQKFHTLSIRRLEAESSTSGSDSEDDNFKFSKSKSHSKQRQKKNRQTNKSQKPPTINQEAKLPKLETHSSAATKSRLDSCSNENKKAESSRTGQHATVNSAPPRLQGGQSTHPQHGWRFVNKYANRSNGGIPIFSEERLKERAEKKERLRSLSQIQGSSGITQLPQLTGPSDVIPPSLPLPLHSISVRGTDRQVNLPSLVWKPDYSQRPNPLFPQTKTRMESSESDSIGSIFHTRERGYSDFAVSSKSSLSHYRNVKRLVESSRRLPTTQQRPYVQKGMAGRPLPPLPVGLPPQLYQYISEIWNKHAGTL